MPPWKQPRVFVYGTLKPGGYYWPRFCEGRVTSSMPARVKGHLFALPVGYPAMTMGDSWVWGHLLTLHDEAVLAGFDSLEDYNPARPASENEYQRVEVDVYLEDGTHAGRVWTYIMDIAKVNAMGGVIIGKGIWEVEDPNLLPPLC